MKTLITPILLTFILFSNSCNSSKSIIYTKGRVWDYNSTFTDTNSVVLLKENLSLTSPGGQYNWQTKIEWEYPKMNTPNRVNLFKLYNPSKIDINLFNAAASEKTGAIEEYDINGPKNSKVNKIWIHPPRVAYYVVTELCPFPTAIYNLDSSQVWNNEMSGLNGFGDWDGITIKSKFIYLGKGEYHNQSCHIIKASSKSEIGSCSAIYYFNEVDGFLKMEYNLHDGNKLVIKLDSLIN